MFPTGAYAHSYGMEGAVQDGLIEDEANGFAGNFVGSLAGPSREEVFVVFYVVKVDDEGEEDEDDVRKYIGSLIGS